MKRALSLLIVLCIIIGLMPYAYAETDTRTMQIVINAGESIAVWNIDITASGVTSNTITVLTDDKTDYDIVFPEDSGTVAMLSRTVSQV